MRGRLETLLLKLAAIALVGCSLASCTATHHDPARAASGAAEKGGRASSGDYVLVHADHLRAGGLHDFVAARRRWLKALAARDTTDGRGLFVQLGDSGFLSLRPLRSLGDIDRQTSAMVPALAGVDAKDLAAYDNATDALLAPPHRNEIWRFDADLSYGTVNPVASISAAAWGKMTVEELDPTPAGNDYEHAWKDLRSALERQSYPLVRVSYWSRYGTGDLVSFWLSKTQTEFLQSPTVESVVTSDLGEEAADSLFSRLKKTVLASESVDVIPRLDLSSKTL